MAIKRGSKVETSFGAASMTDLMFLLLIFFMVATTLINSNALKIVLPQSSNKIDDRPKTTISVTKDLTYYLDNVQMSLNDIEIQLKSIFKGVEKPVVNLNLDEGVPVGELVKLMNMSKRNGYTPYIMTRP